MRLIEEALARRAESDAPLVETLDADGRIGAVHTYRQVTRAAQALADRLTGPVPATPATPEAGGERRVGVVCGNTPAFVVAELATLAARLAQVPVPLAFSAEQARSLLAGVDTCLVDGPGRRQLAAWDGPVLDPATGIVPVEVDALAAAGRPFAPPPVDGDWVAKIVHTSGTTSRPKGVRIRAHGLDALLGSLQAEMPGGAFRRYLSVVPFSLLIEQVTGIHMPILHGGTVTVLPPDRPLVGTAASAPAGVLAALRAARPTALVATPALVDELAAVADAAAARGDDVAETLFGTGRAPLVCCGGAPVQPEVLNRLDAHGVAVYEGYGLSENGSVVCWNRPGQRRFGTVGRPLPHVEVRAADDGELLVRSPSLFAGYTVDDPSSCAVDAEGWLHTGDLAEIDADGYVRITGRKKNVIVTRAGRNVAPEWVEAQYATLPSVRAVAVVGDDLAELHGLFLIDPAADADRVRTAVAELGASRLSAHERVAVAHLVPASDEAFRRFFTVTGRPVRPAVARAVRSGDVGGRAVRPATGRLDGGPGAGSRDDHEHERDRNGALVVAEPGAGIRDDHEHERDDGGALVVAEAGQRLADLRPADLATRLARSGHVLLRGFGPDLAQFSALVRRCSRRVSLDPARSFHGGDVAQKVDAGTAAVGLHLENGNSPFRPDLTWFFCERAARRGSQTTVCDGYRVWDLTGDASRELFLAHDIVYARRVGERAWRAFVAHQTGADPAAVTVDDLAALADEPAATTIEARPDGSIHYAYRTPAVHPTLFGNRLAWANSIFGPSYNYEAPTITLADGRPVPPDVLEEMAAVTDHVTEDVDWQDGDVVVIDNSRVMHGRRAIEDEARTIYNAQSYLEPALLAAPSGGPA